MADTELDSRLETIDLTPSWVGIYRLLLDAYCATKDERVKREMQDELGRMAEAADAWNEHVKAMKETSDRFERELPGNLDMKWQTEEAVRTDNWNDR